MAELVKKYYLYNPADRTLRGYDSLEELPCGVPIGRQLFQSHLGRRHPDCPYVGLPRGVVKKYHKALVRAAESGVQVPDAPFDQWSRGLVGGSVVPVYGSGPNNPKLIYGTDSDIESSSDSAEYYSDPEEFEKTESETHDPELSEAFTHATEVYVPQRAPGVKSIEEESPGESFYTKPLVATQSLWTNLTSKHSKALKAGGIVAGVLLAAALVTGIVAYVKARRARSKLKGRGAPSKYYLYSLDDRGIRGYDHFEDLPCGVPMGCHLFQSHLGRRYKDCPYVGLPRGAVKQYIEELQLADKEGLTKFGIPFGRWAEDLRGGYRSVPIFGGRDPEDSDSDIDSDPESILVPEITEEEVVEHEAQQILEEQAHIEAEEAKEEELSRTEQMIAIEEHMADVETAYAAELLKERRKARRAAVKLGVPASTGFWSKLKSALGTSAWGSSIKEPQAKIRAGYVAVGLLLSVAVIRGIRNLLKEKALESARKKRKTVLIKGKGSLKMKQLLQLSEAFKRDLTRVRKTMDELKKKAQRLSKARRSFGAHMRPLSPVMYW